MSERVLEKTVKQFFSIRIGKWELVLWKITFEADKSVEKANE